MDLFKYNYAADQTNVERGEAINGWKSALWVERYREPGEFELQAQLSMGLREFLPTGTLIARTDSMEIMIVENHEIKETTEEDPTLVITGRTFESFLENRIAGTNQCRAGSAIVEYSLPLDWSFNQAVKLINDHIVNTGDPLDQIANFSARTDLTATPPAGYSWAAGELRVIKRGQILPALLEILQIDDLGIKTIRKNNFAVPGGSNTASTLYIYAGVNRANKVKFSWVTGDIDSAEYLFSDKKLKTSAMVLGRYVNTMVDTGATGKYDRRTMIVDGSDLDGNLSAPPAGAALTTLLAKMVTRGKQALARQNRITISQADISKVTNYQYRRDFNVGDIVTLDGNFGQIAKTRIMEYAEVEDENGESGHPTLSLPGA